MGRKRKGSTSKRQKGLPVGPPTEDIHALTVPAKTGLGRRRSTANAALLAQQDNSDEPDQ